MCVYVEHISAIIHLFSPRRQEHITALNKQIVESGGKPLLGKDPTNISRLEWQTEEFLSAVLHRNGEYRWRFSDNK